MNQHLHRHEAKKVLRRQIRRQRQGLTQPFRTQAAAGFSAGLEQLCRAHPVGPVLAYLPTDEEPPLHCALEKLRLTREIWLPVVQPQRQLLWVRWHPGTQFLPTGPGGLMQPVGPALPVPHKPAMVLVPAVAMDEDGLRLGMGGGFYDTFLAALNGGAAGVHDDFAESHHQSAPVCGTQVACVFHHEVLPSGTVPADPWDARMSLVLTERGVQDLSA